MKQHPGAEVDEFLGRLEARIERDWDAYHEDDSPTLRMPAVFELDTAPPPTLPSEQSFESWAPPSWLVIEDE